MGEKHFSRKAVPSRGRKLLLATCVGLVALIAACAPAPSGGAPGAFAMTSGFVGEWHVGETVSHLVASGDITGVSFTTSVGDLPLGVSIVGGHLTGAPTRSGIWRATLSGVRSGVSRSADVYGWVSEPLPQSGAFALTSNPLDSDIVVALVEGDPQTTSTWRFTTGSLTPTTEAGLNTAGGASASSPESTPESFVPLSLLRPQFIADRSVEGSYLENCDVQLVDLWEKPNQVIATVVNPGQLGFTNLDERCGSRFSPDGSTLVSWSKGSSEGPSDTRHYLFHRGTDGSLIRSVDRELVPNQLPTIASDGSMIAFPVNSDGSYSYAWGDTLEIIGASPQVDRSVYVGNEDGRTCMILDAIKAGKIALSCQTPAIEEGMNPSIQIGAVDTATGSLWLSQDSVLSFTGVGALSPSGQQIVISENYGVSLPQHLAVVDIGGTGILERISGPIAGNVWVVPRFAPPE